MLGKVAKQAGGLPPRLFFHFARAEKDSHEETIMTSKTPDVEFREVTELHKSAKGQLVRAIEALGRLEARVESGEVGPKTEVSKVLGDIRDWLKIAHEMEVRLDRQTQDYAGSTRKGELDLDDARSQIGCRLDRLRRARCPERLSG